VQRPVLLEQNQPLLALEALRSPEPRGLFGFVFKRWSAAVTAEAAVIAGDQHAVALLHSASPTSSDNPVATAIMHRAAALQAGDRPMLLRVAEDFLRAGTTYQQGHAHPGRGS
jgi:hypothetical protein